MQDICFSSLISMGEEQGTRLIRVGLPLGIHQKKKFIINDFEYVHLFVCYCSVARGTVPKAYSVCENAEHDCDRYTFESVVETRNFSPRTCIEGRTGSALHSNYDASSPPFPLCRWLLQY